MHYWAWVFRSYELQKAPQRPAFSGSHCAELASASPYRPSCAVRRIWMTDEPTSTNSRKPMRIGPTW